jgi:hypothetical protein
MSGPGVAPVDIPEINKAQSEDGSGGNVSLTERVERLKSNSAAQGCDNPRSVVMGAKEREELLVLSNQMRAAPNYESYPKTFLGLTVIKVYQYTCLMVGNITTE